MKGKGVLLCLILVLVGLAAFVLYRFPPDTSNSSNKTIKEGTSKEAGLEIGYPGNIKREYAATKVINDAELDTGVLTTLEVVWWNGFDSKPASGATVVWQGDELVGTEEVLVQEDGVALFHRELFKHTELAIRWNGIASSVLGKDMDVLSENHYRISIRPRAKLSISFQRENYMTGQEFYVAVSMKPILDGGNLRERTTPRGIYVGEEAYIEWSDLEVPAMRRIYLGLFVIGGGLIEQKVLEPLIPGELRYVSLEAPDEGYIPTTLLFDSLERLPYHEDLSRRRFMTIFLKEIPSTGSPQAHKIVTRYSYLPFEVELPLSSSSSYLALCKMDDYAPVELKVPSSQSPREPISVNVPISAAVELTNVSGKFLGGEAPDVSAFIGDWGIDYLAPTELDGSTLTVRGIGSLVSGLRIESVWFPISVTDGETLILDWQSSKQRKLVAVQLELQLDGLPVNSLDLACYAGGRNCGAIRLFSGKTDTNRFTWQGVLPEGEIRLASRTGQVGYQGIVVVPGKSDEAPLVANLTEKGGDRDNQ